MIDRRQHRLDRGNRLHAGSWGSCDHDNPDTKISRRLDLGVGRRTTTVFGNQGVDAMVAKQSDLAFHDIRATIQHQLDIGKDERWLDGIDTSHEIEMLRGNFRPVCFLAANRQKNAARARPDRRNCLRYGLDMRPPVFRALHPLGPAQCESRDDARGASCAGIPRDARGERMCRVDHEIKLALPQERDEPLDAAKSTNAKRNRLTGRFVSPAGKREQYFEPAGVGKRLCKGARIAGASQYQDAGPSHV